MDDKTFQTQISNNAIVTELRKATLIKDEGEKLKAYSKGCEELGDWYERESGLINEDILKKHRMRLKAVCLYNLALSSGADQCTLVSKIQSIEEGILRIAGSQAPCRSVKDYIKEIQEYRQDLTTVRELARDHLARIDIASTEVKTIYQNIAEGLKKLVTKMIVSCFELMPPPKDCQYSIIVLGSLAREEATPYSDLEWAILIGKDNEQHRKYFHRITELVWIKILNLQETTPRMMDIQELEWFFETDSPCKKGFSYDGQMISGCHTPLGDRHHTESKIKAIEQSGLLSTEEKATQIRKIKDREYELIDTPEELADYQAERWGTKRGFCTVLSTVAPLISNSDDLLSAYEDNMAAIWKSPVESNPSQTLIQQRSLSYLAESVERFQFKGGYFGKETHYFDAKYHLYRLSNMLIDHLASYFRIESKNLWDRVEHIFGEAGVVHFPEKSGALKQMVSQVLGLRLRAYINKGYRDDHIIMFDPQHPEKNESALKKYLGVNETLIMMIYSELTDFQWRTESFIRQRGAISALTEQYGDMSSFVKGGIYQLLLNYPKALAAFEEAKQIAIVTKGSSHPLVAHTLNRLGVLYEIQARYPEAIEAYNEAKLLKMGDHGPDSLSFAQILSNLGNVYQLQALYFEAEATFEMAKRMKIITHGPEHLSVAHTLHNLGIVYREQARYPEALATFNKAIRLIIATHGPEDILVATILNSLGILYTYQACYPDALALLEEAKRIFITTHGHKHLSVAQTLVNLGNVYLAQTHYSKAIAMFEEARLIITTIHGAYHPSIANTMNNLAGAYIEQTRYPEAIIMLKEAKRIMVATYDREHPSIANMMSNLGNAYHKQTRYIDAIEAFEEAKRIFNAIHGPKHPTAANILNSLGKVYLDQAQYFQAIAAFEEAKRIIILTLGSTHHQVTSPLYNLAKTYTAQCRYLEASMAFEEVKRIKIATFGVNHIEVADALNNLGAVYALLTQYPKAIVVLEKAKRIIIAIHGPAHIAVAGTLNNLGNIYASQDRHIEAIAALEEAKKIMLNSPGYDLTKLAETINNLGNVYKDQARYPEALAMLEEAKQIMTTNLSAEHFSVAMTNYNIGLVFIEQSQYDKARNLFLAALVVFERTQHSYQIRAKNSIRTSYLREGNFFMLKEEMDIHRANSCYYRMSPTLDPHNPITQQKLANESFDANQLPAALEHLRILIRLAPNNVFANQKLACAVHARACIEQRKSEVNQALVYIKEATVYFERAIQLDINSGICTEYAQFLWKNRTHFDINKIIALLVQAINLHQTDISLSYGEIVRSTLDQHLQDLFDQQKKLTIKAIYLAHYLLIQVYCATDQLSSAQYVFGNLQILVNGDADVYPLVKATILQNTTLIKALPKLGQFMIAQLQPILLARETEQRNLESLVESSKAAIGQCILSQTRKSKEPVSSLTLSPRLLRDSPILGGKSATKNMSIEEGRESSLNRKL